VKAVVLGCGPAGLFAAHALIQNGWSVTILSKKRRSEMYGAQYLHKAIPGLAAKEGEVRYVLEGGTTEEYKQKVYGAKEVGSVSPEDIDSGPTRVWDIRTTYFDAWDRYHNLIADRRMLTGMDVSLLMLNNAPDLVVNSIPRYFLCRDFRHKFESKRVWARGDAPERGIFVDQKCPDGYVICNADDGVEWYRLSNIFGYKTIEWTKPHRDAAMVKKPIEHDCECLDDLGLKLLHVGRYGRWQKGVLSHTAYSDTVGRINAIDP
jgi:hypothetical protein